MPRYENSKPTIISDPPHGGTQAKLPPERKAVLLNRVEGISSEADRLHIYLTLEDIFKYDCGLLKGDQLGGLQKALVDGDLMAWSRADSINRKHFDVLVKSINNDLKSKNVRLLNKCRSTLNNLVKNGVVKPKDIIPNGGYTDV